MTIRCMCTELAKKVCPRLRDSVFWRSGEITQPTGQTFFCQLCIWSGQTDKVVTAVDELNNVITK